ncbi:MAG: hypothetical protein SPG48_03375 [Treponema sp.]|nr:hypothetical protein [Spirochaetia bacterium]MDY5682579.1 hypothetical protein [Treponema sp.]
MAEKEMDEILVKCLENYLQEKKDFAQYLNSRNDKVFLQIFAEVKEENDFIINDVQEILKSVDSVESLAEQSEEVISNAFEYLEEYADSFIISADKEQRKKDEAEYEEIQNLLMLFYDEEDGFSEENF